ncbi:hydrolase 1, exosortase A system-associated [Pelomonas sp. V22]|uniref:hydrolase 1, exosortase A system-associated n=1 Tax=Pelomonas sp. V22 TaxID=2822139 RepID=UPI0024A881DE|nr:hydrolase 1, exosortase A system-associated [Pelomonas sp. V22]MDI4631686.1 hydrolase 1, exosortase A system-associated [Pelomonas sp. V22]
MKELALQWSCAGESQLGILSPAASESSSDLGVLIVVGGPQYRVGSHRQFTLLARDIAAAGHVCLRFDVRGMGDSGGAARSFEALDDDLLTAIDELQRHAPQVRRIVLWGLCDGASAALLYLQRRGDARVAGLVLVNPWVRSVLSQARTQVKHYYLQRLRQREFWAKLFSGRVALGAIGELLGALKRAFGPGARSAATVDAHLPYQARMAAAWQAFPGRILLLLSGEDYTAKEFLDHATQDPAWANALQRPGLDRQDCPGMDHTFSGPGGKALAARHTCAWLERLAAGS